MFENKKAWAATILRLVIGVIFLVHGAQKLFVFGFNGVAGVFGTIGIPLPFTSAVIVSLVEFIGGILLILGLFTRWAAIPLIITMLVAFFTAHLPNGFFLPNGFEFVFALIGGLVSLLITGPGELSLGNKIWGRDI